MSGSVACGTMYMVLEKIKHAWRATSKPQECHKTFSLVYNCLKELAINPSECTDPNTIPVRCSLADTASHWWLRAVLDTSPKSEHRD